MFSNWRQTSGSVLVPHVVPMISGSKLGSDAVPSGSYLLVLRHRRVSSVTPLLCSGEGIVVVAEKWRVPDPGKLSAVAGGIVSGAEIGYHVVPSGSYHDIGDAVGGGATSDIVPMSTRQRVANITNQASNITNQASNSTDFS